MTPSPFSRLATSLLTGLVSITTQTFAGVKTFIAESVFSAGLLTTYVRAASASLLLRSDLGAGASDICVQIGPSTLDGAMNATAKAVSIGAGVGGVFTEYFRVTKGGFFAFSGGTQILSVTPGGGVLGGLDQYYSFYVTGSSGGFACAAALRLTSELTDGAGLAAGIFNTTKTWNSATSKLFSWRVTGTEKSAIMSNGEFEHAVAGAGIVLKSPDGTRFRLTISNAGAVVVAAA